MSSRVDRAVFVLLCMCWTASAEANPFDLYGFNPRALSMAGSHTAFADDFTAVYYNPAALTAAKNTGFGVGFTLARPDLSMHFDKPDRLVQDLAPPKADGITFGALFPLGGSTLRNRVAIGFGFSVPTRSLLNGQALDPAIPHWYMYQSLPSRLVAIFGLGVMPFDWLSVGVGVQVLAGVSGSLDYELDVVAGRYTRKTVLFDIEPETAPLLGLELRPLTGLRIGLSYRTEIESPISLPVDLEITGIARLLVLTAFRVQYTPHQLALGASYLFSEWDLSLSCDLTWAMWSRAPDPSVTSSIDVGGDLFEGTGLDDSLDSPAPGQERAVSLAFRDVFIPRVGAEKTFGPWSVRAGYAVRPSPAPSQTSGTNYVDATVHQLSAGVGVHFRDPIQAFVNPLHIDLGVSAFIVPERSYRKIDPQDPVGNFQASGSIFVAGVALRYNFEEAPAAPQAPGPGPSPSPEPNVALGPALSSTPTSTSTATSTTEEAPPVEESLPDGDAEP